MYPVITIFGYEISSYLVLALLGAVVGLALGEVLRRRIGLRRRDYLRFALCFFLGGALGAKLLYVLVEWEAFLSDPVHVLTRGGFVFYGGLLGIFLGAACLCKKKRIPYMSFMDCFIPCVTFFHAFGRVGCLLAGCCYGVATESFCGIIYPAGGIAPAGISLLPVPLFEAVFLFLLTAFLLLMQKRTSAPGRVFGTYLVSYAIWRFFIEFFRGDPRGMILGMSTSQFISIFILLAGMKLLLSERTR